MPRSGILHNPLTIIADGNIIEGIAWGRKTALTLPAAKHTISVVDKNGRRPSNSITIDAVDGESINLICYLNTQTG
ncbi:hypothetical protein SDC9_183601 [bioreactor metagenome]|uniref:Uncharacterized protein n=1 Tax=bioreactor metagenome TaxID=1076179 RepID=A0A645HC51_9ZZZZ